MSLDSLFGGLIRLLQRRTLIVLLVVLALLVLSGLGASRLRLNFNQLELMPKDLPAVREAKKLSEVLGGIGLLMIALKSEQPEHLKQVSNDLTARIGKLSGVRNARNKLDLRWLRDRFPLFVKTHDLKEARRRLKLKIKDLVRRNNPFHITLRETKPVKLELKDIYNKYAELGKKRIADDYNVTPDQKMLLLLVKPAHQATNLGATRDLLARIERTIADYNGSNKRKAKLKEGYGKQAPGATVTYGYAGTYKLNLDDSDQMLQSLIPTSVVSISGILLLLLLFLRRVGLVLGLVGSLICGVVLTFGFCYATVGELNSITAILAGILMGMGIDFGIQFIYRVREEYTRARELRTGLEQAFRKLGPAALATAGSTSAAFFALATSDFKGFRDFGLVAGGGTLIIAAGMMLLPSLLLILLGRFTPGYLDRLLYQPARLAAAERQVGRRFPAPRLVLWSGLALTAVLLVSALAPEGLKPYLPASMLRGVSFNYDARALLLRDRPSIILQEQIRERYKIAATPVGILTPTLKEAKAVYDAVRDTKSDRLGAMKPGKYSMADVVVSLFMFVPPMEQQQANAKILAQMKKDFAPIKPSMLEPEWRKHYAMAMRVLDARPFTLGELPDYYRTQFVNEPDSKIKGYVTFIYPKIAMYDSRDLVAFSDQVGVIQTPGKAYHATGTPILFAHLAQIVLHDGKFFTLFAGGMILLIIFIALRGVVATLVALLPLAMGMIWMMGLMALLGQQVNFMNVVVFPVVLGYGMGSGIYILHRFRESGSAWVALTRTGRAVLASCVTTLVGWGSLMTAGHLGLESMGMLAALGIGCVLVTSVVFLPAVLRLLTNWFHIKWGHSGDQAAPADKQD